MKTGIVNHAQRTYSRVEGTVKKSPVPFLKGNVATKATGPACPNCKERRSGVVDSRQADDAVRRRRQCYGCGDRFTTYEQTFQPVNGYDFQI